jgi:D-glycero-alpha-D-manno-heptose 1-phosphate guanylyltransferase
MKTGDSKMAAIDVVILSGGKGERLRTVSGEVPKILMPIAGRPFIDIVIESLLPFGFRRFILCIGYLREKVRAHFAVTDYDVVFSEETEPLGTGGAVKNAGRHIITSPFLLLNGDSFCPADLHAFYNFHLQKGGVLSIVLSQPLSENAYGVVQMDDENRIVAFREKEEAGEGSFINAGLYLAERRILGLMPEKARFSLETELIPAILPHGCYGFVTDAELIDIGTPERYVTAEQRLSKNTIET